MLKPKTIVKTIFLIVVLIFIGCIEISVIFKAETRLVETHMNRIVEAISDNDRLALKRIFSKQALIEAENIDEDINNLYELVEGDIIAWGDGEHGGWGSSSHNDHGITTTMIRGWQTVETSEGDYSVFILFYPEDDTHPDNIGLYALWMCKVEDKEEFYPRYWTDMNIAGIHIPDEPQS